MIEDASINPQTILILVVGFLAGMIPAMLVIGFYGGSKIEKQRRALQLKYDRQINTLKATIRRLMNRIDLLTSERNLLKRSNNSLRDAIKNQHHIMDEASLELEETRSKNELLEEKIKELSEENIRHEGRLEQAISNQENLTSQFHQTISQLTEADKMRRHLLFATNQLREAQITNQALESQFSLSFDSAEDDENGLGDNPDQQDVSIIQGLEPENAEKLHESGIHTVSDLAKQSPTRVAYFTGQSGWNEPAAWIAEAKARIARHKRYQA